MEENLKPLLTHKSLWEGFVPDGSLQPSKVSELRFDKITYSEYYFSGREILPEKERVRIFAVYAVPDDVKDLNAILYIPDVTESINYEMVTEYAKMGYAVLAVDLYGKKSDAQNYTNYPESVSYANYESRERRMDFVDTAANETSWYEWACVCRYAISFLESQPNVCKIGVIGVKDGANVAWQLAATDSRIDCSVMLFGAGWSAYKGVFRYGEQSDIVMDEERRRYIAGIEAHAYAQSVNCPILFLSSTNSDRFDFDRSFDTLSRVPEGVECIFNYAPSFREYLDERCKKNVELFLKKHLEGGKTLFFKTPELEIKCEGKLVKATVICQNEESVVECKVFVNEGVVDPALRNWNLCQQIDDDKFKFEQVLSGNSTRVFAFATVRYRSGVTLTSRIANKKTELTPSHTSGLIYSSRDGLDGISFYDEKLKNEKRLFLKKEDHIEIVKGPNDIYGAYSPNGLISYKFGEPGCNINEKSLIKLDVYTSGFATIRLLVMQKSADEIVEYVYEERLNTGDLWKNLRINLADFKTVEGRPLRKFDGIFALRFEGDRFSVNNVLLI